MAVERASFTLRIVAPHVIQEQEVSWCEVWGASGEFVIGPDHIPLISLLRSARRITFRDISGTTGSVEISDGIVMIDENLVVVLITSME